MALITKPNTFSSGATIVASEHNSNFDTIYDDYNGSITNANIGSSAAIVGSKLDLSSPGTIGGSTASPGTFTNLTSTGNTTLGNASGDDVTITGSIAASIPLKAENIDIGTTSIGLNDVHFGSGGIINWDGGDVTLTHAANKLTWGGSVLEIDFANHEMTNVDIDSGAIDGTTIGAAATSSIKCTTLDTGGKLTAGSNEIEGSNFDINGGTMDGVQIGGTTATGELIVNNATDDADGLGDQGTTGQLLTSAGVGANPTWANAGMKLISTTTVAAAADSGDIVIEPSKQYYVTFEIDNATTSTSTLSIRFNDDSTSTGYRWSGQSILMNTTATITTDGDESDAEITLMEDTVGYELNMQTSTNNGFIRGNMFIDTNKIGTAVSAFIVGEFIAGGSSVFSSCTFGGIVALDITIADFQFLTSQDVNMTIKTYELA